MPVAIGGAVLWTITGIPLGVTSAPPGQLARRLGTTFVLAGLSFPTFVVGLLLLYFLFFRLTLLGIEWFPAAGYVPLTEDPWQWARHLILPWFTVAFATAVYTRLTRGQMLEVFGEDYIRTARQGAVGAAVYRHGLRSAVTPLFTQFGLDVALLLGGLVVTEQIFGLPGIGRLAVESVIRGDQPIIIGTVLFAASSSSPTSWSTSATPCSTPGCGSADRPGDAVADAISADHGALALAAAGEADPSGLSVEGPGADRPPKPVANRTRAASAASAV